MAKASVRSSEPCSVYGTRLFADMDPGITTKKKQPSHAEKDLPDKSIPGLANSCILHIGEFAVGTRHDGIPTLLVLFRSAQIQPVQLSGKSCRAICGNDLPVESIPGLANSCILHIWEFAVGTRHAGIPTLLVRVRAARSHIVVSGSREQLLCIAIIGFT